MCPSTSASHYFADCDASLEINAIAEVDGDGCEGEILSIYWTAFLARFALVAL